MAFYFNFLPEVIVIVHEHIPRFPLSYRGDGRHVFGKPLLQDLPEFKNMPEMPDVGNAIKSVTTLSEDQKAAVNE